MRSALAEDRTGRPILDLRDAAEVPELPDLPTLSDEERQMAVRTWRGRMVNEHVSAQVFAGLVPAAMRAALPPALQAEIPAMIADEYRHARQCAGVVVALGGVPVAPLPPIDALPAHDEVGPTEALLRHALSVGCVSETVAVSVIRAEQAELEGTALGAVLNRILADEVQHARFGWRLAGLLTPLLDADARARTSGYLVEVFRHAIAWEVPKLPLNLGLRAEVAQAGVCDGGDARALFFDTMAEVIVPQLDALGLDASAAWAVAAA